MQGRQFDLVAVARPTASQELKNVDYHPSSLVVRVLISKEVEKLYMSQDIDNGKSSVPV